MSDMVLIRRLVNTVIAGYLYWRIVRAMERICAEKNVSDFPCGNDPKYNCLSCSSREYCCEL